MASYGYQDINGLGEQNKTKAYVQNKCSGYSTKKCLNARINYKGSIYYCVWTSKGNCH